jgi:hypothetical protein
VGSNRSKALRSRISTADRVSVSSTSLLIERIIWSSCNNLWKRPFLRCSEIGCNGRRANTATELAHLIHSKERRRPPLLLLLMATTSLTNGAEAMSISALRRSKSRSKGEIRSKIYIPISPFLSYKSEDIERRSWTNAQGAKSRELLTCR